MSISSSLVQSKYVKMHYREISFIDRNIFELLYTSVQNHLSSFSKMLSVTYPYNIDLEC